MAAVGPGLRAPRLPGLRRALATFRRLGDIHQFQDRFLAGMAKNGWRSEPPASNKSTRLRPSSERRAAITLPAEPAPTIT